MRFVILAAGILMSLLGFAAHSKLGDPLLLQGALTLGGGWLICAIFSLKSKWHGISGAGVLALLAGANCLPALTEVGESPAAPYRLAALALSALVLGLVVRALLAERARRNLESLQASSP